MLEGLNTLVAIDKVTPLALAQRCIGNQNLFAIMNVMGHMSVSTTMEIPDIDEVTNHRVQ